MRPISTELFRAVVPAIVLALIGAGLLLDRLIVERLEQDFDEVLATKVQALRAMTELENNVIEIEPYDHALPAYTDPDDPDYFVMLGPDEQVIARSESAGDTTWLASIAREGAHEHRDVVLPDGRAGRSIARQFVPLIDDDDVENGETSVPVEVTLVVAVSRESLDRLIDSVRLLLGGTGFALVVLIVLLARRGIRATLAPLERIGTEIAALDPDRLDQRLVAERSSTELARLTSRFNALLERLEIAFARERRFSADVAHELRTPLAELRTLGEVNAHWPTDESLRANFAHDYAAALERMEGTVSNLLALARSESGVDPVSAPGDLVALVERSVDAARTRAAARGLAFELNLPAPPLTLAGEVQWRAILGNLVENAVEYAEADTTVSVSLVRDALGERYHLSVANRTDALAVDDLPRMFERLWRKDPARSASRHGGLGLSLVAAYANQLGVEVNASLDGKGSLIVRLSGQLPPLEDGRTDILVKRPERYGPARGKAPMTMSGTR